MTPKQFIKNIIQLGIKENLSPEELAESIKEAMKITDRFVEKGKKSVEKNDKEKKILLKGDAADRMGTRYDGKHETSPERLENKKHLEELARPLGSAAGGYLVILKNKNTGAVKREPSPLPYEEAQKKAGELKKIHGSYYDVLVKPYNKNLESIPTDKEVTRKRGRKAKVRDPNSPVIPSKTKQNKEDDLNELPPDHKFTGAGLNDPDKWHLGTRLDILGKMFPSYDLTQLNLKDSETEQVGKVVKADNNKTDQASRITVRFEDGEEHEYIVDKENPKAMNDFKKLWVVGGSRVKI